VEAIAAWHLGGRPEDPRVLASLFSRLPTTTASTLGGNLWVRLVDLEQRGGGRVAFRWFATATLTMEVPGMSTCAGSKVSVEMPRPVCGSTPSGRITFLGSLVEGGR
jgi:hypothetical protein